MIKSLIATVFLACHRMFHVASSASQAIFEGCWMGVLSDSMTDSVVEKSYADADYMDKAYLDHGFQFWEEIAVRRFFAPGSRVLVGAAGGGREIIALFRAGYSAIGFDCARAMVAAGNLALRERGIESRIDWAAPCALPEIKEVFDGAIVGWNGYTYISPRNRRLAFLKSIRTHLRPGSPVLLSFAIRAGNSKLSLWTPRVANAVRRLTFRQPVFDRGAGFPGRPRHQFTKLQVEAELREAGFAPAEFWKWGVFGAAVCLAQPDIEHRLPPRS